jgi:hypothetical protein
MFNTNQGIWSQVTTISDNAKERLNEFVRETLLEGKYVTKSYAHTHQMYGGDTSPSVYKFVQIVNREFLKRNPTIKDVSFGHLGSRISHYGLAAKRSVITRYMRRMLRKLNAANAGGVFEITVREEFTYYYPPTTSVNRQCISTPYSKIQIRYNCQPYGTSNPYTIFLLIEDFIKVLETISRYAMVENSPHPVKPFYSPLGGAINAPVSVPY